MIQSHRSETSSSRNCIHHIFEQQVHQTPNAVAVVFQDQHLTYQELDQRANQLAHYLQQQGVTSECLVGVFIERSLDMVVGLLAILKAGGAYVPLDPQYPRERLSWILNDTQVSIVLTQNRWLEHLPPSPYLTLICLDKPLNPPRQNGFLFGEVAAHNLAYVMYTSGSTGYPKGVCIPHQGVVRLVRNQNYIQITPNDTFLQLAPISFDASTFEIWGALLNGARLVLMPPGLAAIEEIGETIQVHQISILWLTSGLFSLMVDNCLNDLKTVHKLLAGGDVLSSPHVFRYLEACEDGILINGYGPTENTTFTCCFPMSNRWKSLKTGPIPIGRPIAKTQVYVLDQQMQPVPIGIPGELYIGGEGLARGYLNQPELTAQKFVPNPFGQNPEDRLYKTGDRVCYRTDGNLEFWGRFDYQIKLRGYRIEPGEIEAALLEHPAVRQAVVMAQEDPLLHKYLAAYVVLNEIDIPEKELRHFLKSLLPDYMVPGTFVRMKSLPLTPNGKIDRKQLKAPEKKALSDSETGFRTKTAQKMAQIWQEILGIVPRELHADFFECGGDSLRAMQLITRISHHFQVKLPISFIFQNTTFCQMTERVDLLQSSDLVPVQKQHVPTTPALSSAQKSLWLLEKLLDCGGAYNVPFAWKMEGPIDTQALEWSMNEIIKRHSSLRTYFKAQNGTPFLEILPALFLPLEIVDLQHIPCHLRETVCKQQMMEKASIPFELKKAPLIRAVLFHLETDVYFLFVNMHHIICDAWSVGIWVKELSDLYAGYHGKNVAQLAPVPQFLGFQTNQKLDSLISYWQNQLAGSLPQLQLPMQKKRPSEPCFQGQHIFFSFPKKLLNDLKALSQRENVTLFMVLLAAFNTLLFRYSDQEDILVGSPIAHRSGIELENIIGFFVNTVVLRTDLSGDPTFCQLLKQVKKTTLDAYAHQELPFEKLVESLNISRDLSHNPLFQIMFVLQNTPMPPLKIADAHIQRLNIAGHTSRFDLTFSLTDSEKELVGEVEFNTSLFDENMIQRMIGHYQCVLKSIGQNPNRPISKLSLLSEHETRQLLAEYRPKDAIDTAPNCIHQLFEAQVQKTPQAIAAVFQEQQLTYHQLNERAAHLAAYLQQIGIGPECLVGVCMERSLDMLVTLLGILKAGGAYVPLDPQYPSQHLTWILEDTQVKVIITQKKWLEYLEHHSAKMLCFDTNWGDISQNAFNSKTQIKATPQNLAYVIYTSGSTGKPKGVMVTHRSLVHYVESVSGLYGIDATQRMFNFVSLNFDASIEEIFTTLCRGASLVIHPNPAQLSVRELLSECQKQQVTILHLPTVYWYQIVKEIPDLPQAFPTCISKVITGGESALMDKYIQWRKYVPASLQLFNAYGPTETTVTKMIFKASAPMYDLPRLPLGRPIAKTQVYVLDQQMQPVPIGVPGELYIGGEGLARGYLNQPELTAQKFVPNPFGQNPEDRLYKTGDRVCYRSDGNLEFLGRFDYQIKLRGYRIEPGEIEAALLEHPAVQQAVVMAQEDLLLHKYLAAYVVLNGTDIPEKELRHFLKSRLPAYMVPGTFVRMQSLPLTPNGKIDRKQLRPPKKKKVDKVTNWPQTEIEKKLAQIWQKLLGISQIGLEDDFFSLGGDSLRAVQLMDRIQQVFGVKLAFSILFKEPTVKSIANSIENSHLPSFATETRFEIPDMDININTPIGQTGTYHYLNPAGSRLFLTGATGFLGSFLLYELLKQTQADIHCLVRAVDEKTALARLKSKLESAQLWEPAWAARIIPVLGNLSKPLLGLSEERFELLSHQIDVIYHNGAWVNLFYPYEKLEASNVMGTREILQLAGSRKIKPVHYVSTLGIFLSEAPSQQRTVYEHEFPNSGHALSDGYSRSKWVAENLVVQARLKKLPVQVYRSGRIGGHSQSGRCNTSDLFLRLLIGCIQMEHAPELDMQVEMTPVDYISRAIIHLSFQEHQGTDNYHLCHPQPVSWQRLLSHLQHQGYSIRQLPYSQWLDVLLVRKPEILLPLLPFLQQETSFLQFCQMTRLLKFDAKCAQYGLANTAIACPPLEGEFFDRMLSFLAQEGSIKKAMQMGRSIA